jgi:hypothetical protein
LLRLLQLGGATILSATDGGRARDFAEVVRCDMPFRAFLRTVAAFFASAAVCVTAGVAVGEPASYVLMCHGSPHMQYELHPDLGDGMSLNLAFSKSTKAGSALPPPKGTCTWVDRPIRADEPSKIVMRSKGWFSMVCIQAQCKVLGISPTAAGIRDIYLKVRAGQPFQVRAFNDGKGNFIVTKYGP